MSKQKKVYIILPCFNEEEGLTELLERFKRIAKMSPLPFEFIVVNDGSSDHSKALADTFVGEIPLTVIDFQTNKGVAEVYNHAFRHVMENASDDDYIVSLDSDNTMNPFVSLDIVEELGRYDIVIASRFVEGGSMIGVGPRIILSYGASWLMQWRANIPGVRDYSIFYRGYRVSIIKKLFNRFGDSPIQGKGFACMANLLLQLREVAPETRFHEIPLVLNYYRKTGQSGINILKTILGYIKLAFPSKD